MSGGWWTLWADTPQQWYGLMIVLFAAVIAAVVAWFHLFGVPDAAPPVGFDIDVPLDELAAGEGHQPRDHAVRCRRCRRRTWAHTAICEHCDPDAS